MTDADYAFICRFLKDRSAIHLDPDKQYLVESRLAPVMRQMDIPSIDELVRRLRDQPSGPLPPRVVEAMVTSETSFFRDHHPFEALRKAVLPDLIEKRRTRRRLAIWCAACSTGQEPYSVAILLREHFPALAGWQVTLLATDLSREVLEKARLGRYTQFEVNRGMPAMLLIKYFTQHGTAWQLKDEIRNMVEWRELNLARAWPPLPVFDLVMMRNVMIYFDVETKKDILGRLGRGVLASDGYLLLGGAETTFNLDPSYRRVEHHKCGLYQRP